MGLLVGYKRENPDFRYLVRNGEQDIKVLIKRISEGERLSYRNLEINVLGRISPLKTVCKVEASGSEEVEESDAGEFQLDHNRRNNRNYIPKEQIYRNITSILDGFALLSQTEKKQRDQMRGWE